MTLIAFHTDAKRAHVMTDTWSYTLDCTLGVLSKQTPIPHLDLVVAAQGSTGFHARALAQSIVTSRDTADLDQFLDGTPARLRALWAEMRHEVTAENLQSGAEGSIANSIIFNVGYSPAAGRFVAFGYASEQDFEPVGLTDQPYVQPTPLSARPGPIERGRLRTHFEHNRLKPAALDVLDQRPPIPAPRSKPDWIQLAKQVRVDRSECSLYSGFKTYIGGDVHLTTLTVGSAETKRIHQFADDTETLQRIFAGSLHPISQHGPCSCGSGRSYIDCCLGEGLNGRQCPCGSPYAFEQCCSVLAVPDSAWAGQAVSEMTFT